eukprot:jgi/Bigna1/71106/fgenesh1_pg.14_\
MSGLLLLSGGTLWMQAKEMVMLYQLATAEADPACKEEIGFLAKVRHKIVGNYENRIRQMSNPHKIFDYFASKRDSKGNPLMTPDDFVRSITHYGGRSHDQVGNKAPSDYSSSPSIVLKKNKHDDSKIPVIFRRLSQNGDGLLRLDEYLLLTTLLAIPPDLFDVAFRMSDVNGDGNLEGSEFKKVMAMMYNHSAIAKSLKPRPQNFEDIVPVPPGLFGGGYTGTRPMILTLETFSEVLKQLREEVWRIQFSMFDGKGEGHLCAHAFASHIASFATWEEAPRLEALKSMLLQGGAADVADSKNTSPTAAGEVAKQLEDLNNAEFYWEDWLAFHGSMRMFSASGAPVTRKEFQRLVKIVSGYELSNNTLNMVFYLYDSDKSGTLDEEEFGAALEMATGMGLQRHRDIGMTRMVDCIRKCQRKANSY